MRRALAPTPLLALILLAPLTACQDDGDGGDDVVGDGDGDSTTGDGDGAPAGDGDGAPAGDGDGAPAGDGDGAPAGDGDGAPTGDGDGDPTGDGDGDPTGDGDGDPPIMDNSTYTATLMPGPPDRITIRRVNNDEPTCTHMVLVKPGFDSFDITITQSYAIEEALVWQQGFCPMDLANPHGEPTMGTGTITFGSLDALGTYPCSLNFDLEINNATDPPSMSVWKKTGVPVTGVNCG